MVPSAHCMRQWISTAKLWLKRFFYDVKKRNIQYIKKKKKHKAVIWLYGFSIMIIWYCGVWWFPSLANTASQAIFQRLFGKCCCQVTQHQPWAVLDRSRSKLFNYPLQWVQAEDKCFWCKTTGNKEFYLINGKQMFLMKTQINSFNV